MAKLNWGIVGGGEGSQIGPAHRLGAGLDGLYNFTAGALDHRPEEGKRYAQELVATPNSTHFEITKAFLEAGFNVLCEKPMTMTVDEGEEIVRVANSTGRICAVNYGYTGYSLVRHMRAMVAPCRCCRCRQPSSQVAL